MDSVSGVLCWGHESSWSLVKKMSGEECVELVVVVVWVPRRTVALPKVVALPALIP